MEPVHLLYPYSNGKVYPGGNIGKHSKTPKVSQEKINFKGLNFNSTTKVIFLFLKYYFNISDLSKDSVDGKF